MKRSGDGSSRWDDGRYSKYPRKEEARKSPPAPKEKPNYQQSGLLQKEANSIHGVALKYNPPPEARLPDIKWRIFVFEGDDDRGTISLDKQSSFLVGREKVVADILLEHESCSLQHAAIQFRLVGGSSGEKKKEIKPYLIDLKSTNGTFLNGSKISSSRFYELLNKDVVKFGKSEREFALIKEAEGEDD
jgi:smad nuclear-interacting protein 1